MTNGTAGPFGTEREARESPAARAVYAAFDADPGPGKMAPHNYLMLIQACEAAGVDLGDPSSYDRQILAWVARWEPATCAVLAGLINRASADRRPGPAGLVTAVQPDGSATIAAADVGAVLGGLDDAIEHCTDEDGCQECMAAAGSSCESHAARLARVPAYRSLARALGGNPMTRPPLTARGVRLMLARAGVDYSALTITDDPAIWTDLETGVGSTSVVIRGPKDARRRATAELFWQRGLGHAPYPEYDMWSRR